MRNRAWLFCLSLGIWLMLHWSLEPMQLILGCGVGIAVSLLTADMFARSGIFRRPLRYFWFCYYIPVFCWECLKANIDGAYRVAHPDVPMHPGIVKIKTSLTSEVGLIILANSLTLKPGTMTVDIDKEQGILYVHWVDVKGTDMETNTEMIAGKFERILKRIFA